MPSVFFSSLFCLKLANAKMLSATPILPMLSMNLVDSSHLEPKLDAFSVSVSLVCKQKHQSRSAALLCTPCPILCHCD